jgi:carbon storage regulator
MLVLSRKPLQSIMIGPDIKITLVKVERNQVRIGIEAPRDVTILRDELIEASPTDSSDGSEQLNELHVLTS